MDFIKKHFEKILLASALLILIGVAAYLAIQISDLSEEIKETVAARRVIKPIDRSVTGTYSNTISGLEHPSVWHSNTNDPFNTGLYLDALPDVPAPHIADIIPSLMAIKYKQLPLIFTSYTGDGKNIAINHVNPRHTYLNLSVGDEIKDQFKSTGYFIRKFEHKIQMVKVPGFDTPRADDVSELTVQQGNDGPTIVLVLNKKAYENEPEASFQCAGDTPQSLPQLSKVRKDKSFSCGTHTYNVIDINSTQVILKDELEDQHIFKLPGAKE